MASRPLIAEVALPVSIALDETFDYFLPQRLKEAAQPGLRVRVPFRNKTLTGYLIAIKQSSPYRRKCKPVLDLVDEQPLLDEVLWDLARQMRHDYVCALGDVLNTLVPQSVRRETRRPDKTETVAQAAVFQELALSAEELEMLRQVPRTPAITVISDPSDIRRWGLYAALIKDTLNHKKSVILTVPRHDLLDDALSRLPGLPQPFVLSSYQKVVDQRRDWKACRAASFCFVIGTRSAVFAPVRELGLIIVDDDSHFAYHQDQAPCYRTSDIAKRRVRDTEARLVLGGVLASLENEMLCKKGEASLVALDAPDRGPAVTLLDFTRAPDSRGRRTGLSQAMAHHVSLCLQAKEKALIVAHQKCYVSALYCRRCRKAVTCPRCSVPLKEYRDEKTLRCGICGHHDPVPELCPVCRRSYVRQLGFGTQRALSELRKLFPAASVKTGEAALHPSDGPSAQTAGLPYDIILATPGLLADPAFKGVLHGALFDRVFVLDADQPLAVADFRAAERTFSEFWRMRLFAKKELCLQTRWPGHYVFEFLSATDPAGFRNRELKERSELSWPPTRPLVCLTVRSASLRQARSQAGKVVRTLRERLGEAKDTEVCDPAQARPFKVRGNYRFQIFVKAADLEPVRVAATHLMKKIHGRVHLIFDPNGG